MTEGTEQTKPAGAASAVERIVGPEWDDDGMPINLLAAAEDADEWLALIERLHGHGKGPWKFSQADTYARLRECRRALRRLLTPNKELRGDAPQAQRPVEADRPERT